MKGRIGSVAVAQQPGLAGIEAEVLVLQRVDQLVRQRHLPQDTSQPLPLDQRKRAGTRHVVAGQLCLRRPGEGLPQTGPGGQQAEQLEQPLHAGLAIRREAAVELLEHGGARLVNRHAVQLRQALELELADALHPARDACHVRPRDGLAARARRRSHGLLLLSSPSTRPTPASTSTSPTSTAAADEFKALYSAASSARSSATTSPSSLTSASES